MTNISSKFENMEDVNKISSQPFEFKDKRFKTLLNELNDIIPMEWKIENKLNTNAEVDTKDDKCVISYKPNAHEAIDIAHELIHIEMFYKDHFCQLAWRKNNPPAPEIETLVKNIRNIVDDTYVLSILYSKYQEFPISDIFFKGCEEDISQGEIAIRDMKSKGSENNEIAFRAWRLRIAELAFKYFGGKIELKHEKIARAFDKFKNKYPEVNKLLDKIRDVVKIPEIEQINNHKSALIALKDYFEIPDIIYLAQFEKKNGKFCLIRCRSNIISSNY